MKKFYFLFVAMLVSLAAQAWTVKFTNPDNWETVACYTFSPETNGGWPGKVMTKEGDVWTYTGTGTPGKIIFNNNNKGSQTGNLDFVDGATYDKDGVVGAEKTTYTVYFDNSASNWDNVYVYTFGPQAAGNWPGTKLSANADGLYVWEYEATSEPSFGGIIFNNGAGTQTENLTYEAGATYDKNGVVGAKLEKYTVYFDNTNSNWDEVYVYTFEPQVAGDWPGTKLSVNADGLYEWVYESTTTPSFGGLIFNNNNGSQTDDLTFEAGKTYSTEQVEIDYTTWYVNVVGDFNGWGDNGQQCNADGVATLNNLAIGTSVFKIKIWNGSEVWYSNGEANAIDTPIVINGNSDINMTIEGAAEGDVYNVTFDCKNNTMTIEKVAKIDYTTWYVNVPGSFNGWEDNGVACDEEGIATIENLEIGTGEFKIKIWNGSEVWYSNGEANAIDTPIAIIGNNNNGMTIEGAEEGDVYNVTFDCKSNTMTITKAAVVVPEYPDLFLVAYEDEPQLSFADGVYSIVLPNLSDDGWSIGNMDDMNVIAIKEGTEVKENTPFEVYYISYSTLFEGDWLASTDFTTNNKVKISLTGDVDAFVADSMKPIKMIIDTTVGVEGIEANEAGAVYFNLQGVRVANPENGMFIKVQGNKATKVAL